jgi:hypothetical protein
MSSKPLLSQSTDNEQTANPAAANDNEPQTWDIMTFDREHGLTRHELLQMFHGEVAGIRMPEFLTPDQCATVVARLKGIAKQKARRYKGNLNIGTVLDVPSHWEFTYVIEDSAAWHPYFAKVGPTTRLRRHLFRDIGDPVDRVTEMLAKAWGAPVYRMRKFGKKLYAGLIRSGAPKLHFDWAPWDLGKFEVVMQAGLNIYLANGSTGGDLKVYRTYGMSKGNTLSSNQAVVGNYDLPQALVQGVKSATIPCRAGDLVVAPNRFLHEVTETDGPEQNRLSLSFHIALMADGSLAIFS